MKKFNKVLAMLLVALIFIISIPINAMAFEFSKETLEKDNVTEGIIYEDDKYRVARYFDEKYGYVTIYDKELRKAELLAYNKFTLDQVPVSETYVKAPTLEEDYLQGYFDDTLEKFRLEKEKEGIIVDFDELYRQGYFSITEEEIREKEALENQRIEAINRRIMNGIKNVVKNVFSNNNTLASGNYLTQILTKINQIRELIKYNLLSRR